jgi:hypothetical protein
MRRLNAIQEPSEVGCATLDALALLCPSSSNSRETGEERFHFVQCSQNAEGYVGFVAGCVASPCRPCWTIRSSCSLRTSLGRPKPRRGSRQGAHGLCDHAW